MYIQVLPISFLIKVTYLVNFFMDLKLSWLGCCRGLRFHKPVALASSGFTWQTGFIFFFLPLTLDGDALEDSF